MSEQPSSKEQVDHSLEDLETLCDYAYDNGFHELGYCPVKMVKDEIDRLQQDVRRYESGRVVLTGEIEELKKKLSARLQQIEELRMAERLNVETVAELQKERDALKQETIRLYAECRNWKELHDADEACIADLERRRRSEPPKAVPREWIISYSNYLATDLNRAYAHGAQSLDADVADAKHRAMEVDAWLRATSTKAESPRLEDIVDSENWCPQCAHPRGACVCAHETGECPNCFDDKTVTMSDGSKRPCELCAEVAACPDCGMRPAIDGMWHKPGCASL